MHTLNGIKQVMAAPRLGSIFSVGSMTMVSRVLGLVRDLVFANTLGIGPALDAFLAAFRIPNLLRRIFGEGALSLAVVPVATEYKENNNTRALKDLLDHTFGTLALILLALSILGSLAAPWLIKVIAYGFTIQPEARPDLAGDILRVVFPYIFFISLTAFASAILNSFNRFLAAAFTPVLLNVALITAALGFQDAFTEPVMALAWGVFIGGILQLMFLVPSLIKLGMLPRPRFKRGHEGVKKIIRLMIPAIFGSSVAQLNILLNTFIASFLAVGSISWLYLSDRYVELPLAIIGVAIATVVLPSLSSRIKEGDHRAFQTQLHWAIEIGLLAAIPATVGLIIFAKQILITFILNGRNTWLDVEMASLSLQCYSVGLAAFILVKILVPAFYARQDSKTPVSIGIISVVGNIIITLALVTLWHHQQWTGAHAGLALATAMAGFINVGLLLLALHQQGIFRIRSIVNWALLKIVSASVVMAITALLITPDNAWWQNTAFWLKLSVLLGLVAASMGVYAISLWALNYPFSKIRTHPS